jgi:hypothetical protein
MNKDDVRAVMAQAQLLTNSGILDPASDDFDAERAELLNEVDGCSLTESWVKDLEKTKTFNTEYTSYWLKHVLEDTVGYCTNGAFIAAMIHCGFKYKRCDPTSPNVYFNLSGRSLKESVHKLDPEHHNWTFDPPRAKKEPAHTAESAPVNKNSAVRYAGRFYVENGSANSRNISAQEGGGLCIANLRIGVRVSHQGVWERHPVTCTMVGASEVDYEINQIIRDLETIRREAKKLLIKHRKDDEEYLRRSRLQSPPDN